MDDEPARTQRALIEARRAQGTAVGPRHRPARTQQLPLFAPFPGLVNLLYGLQSRTGAGGNEKGSRRAVPVR